MENEQEVVTLDLGRIGYEAYREHTGGISLATGQAIPNYDGLAEKIRLAWDAAAFAIHEAVAKKAMQDVLADLALVEGPEHPTPEQVITLVQKPSIGRIVIYHHPDIGDVPAIVTKVLGGVLDALHLFVMTPTDGGYSRRSPVYYGHKPEHWSWPERV